VLADHLIHPIPDSLPCEQAIYTEPLAAALEITSQLHIRPEQNVALIGDGRLAFMIAQVIALTGVDLTILGKHPDKLKAFEAFGRTALEPQDTYEVVIDATGAPSGIALAGRIVRRKGTIVLKSTYAGKTSLNLSELVVNEITIMGSRCGPFEPAMKLLERKQVKLPAIELWELSQYREALDSHAFKVGFRF
jgi:threonine dehydrogenase-like Zn-dependent dehydrogenase